MPMMLVKAADTPLCNHLSNIYLSDHEKKYLSRLSHPKQVTDYVTSRLMSKLLLLQFLSQLPSNASQLELYGPPAAPPKLYFNLKNSMVFTYLYRTLED